MPAYVLIETHVTDDERAARYRERSGPSVARHGGRFVVRGGATHVLEGEWDPERVVVIEFPTMAAALAWYGSAEYAEARAVREGAGRWHMVAVEGVD